MALRTCQNCGHIYNKDRQCAKCFPDPKRAEIKRLREQGLRRCSKCQEILPLDCFDKRPQRNSFVSSCKACRKIKSDTWRKANPENVRQMAKRNRERHPERVRVERIRHHARARGLPDTFTLADWQRAIAHWQGHCAYCGNPEGLLRNMTISAEHFIPLSSPDCPGTVPSNILPICLSCNASRKKRDVGEWMTAKFGRQHADRALAKITEYFDFILQLF